MSTSTLHRTVIVAVTAPGGIDVSRWVVPATRSTSTLNAFCKMQNVHSRQSCQKETIVQSSMGSIIRILIFSFRMISASSVVARMVDADGGGGLPIQQKLTASGPEGPLRGTLSLPVADSAIPDGTPVVLIVPGSGPTDRDGNSPLGISAAPYALLAEALVEQGIPSVRIDKRGMFGPARGARSILPCIPGRKQRNILVKFDKHRYKRRSRPSRDIAAQFTAGQ